MLVRKEGLAIRRRERTSERWRAMGVGPHRKVRNADLVLRIAPWAIVLSTIVAASPQISDRAARVHRDALVFDAHVHVVDRQFYQGGDMPFF